jgi:hypothetical protein
MLLIRSPVSYFAKFVDVVAVFLAAVAGVSFGTEVASV